MKCKDCKFYTKENGFDFGSCNRWDYGYSISPIPLNELRVENDEGWGAKIGPEFGCVLFEPKLCRNDKT